MSLSGACILSVVKLLFFFLEPNKSNSAQPQQIVIPTSGGGTQMIVNGALNGAVQPFVMQQVMQIQDPNTGQIQTGINHTV